MREVIWLYQSPAFIKDDLCLENVLLFVVLHTVSLNIGDSQVFSKYQAIPVRLAISLRAKVTNQASPLSSKALFVSYYIPP